MSIQMQEAFTKDMAVMKENGDHDYVDAPAEEIPETNIKETISKEKDEIEVKLDELI